MRNICMIPARGGSKRIPKKNIIDFHGKPMISYTIEAALKSGLFGDHIYISSDADEILSVADHYDKVRKLKRPDALSGDTTSLEEVTFHLLATVGPENFDSLCMLLPNCPLRTEEDIVKSYQLMRGKKAAGVMSVVAYHWLRPFWAMRENEEGFIEMFFGKQFLADAKDLLDKMHCPAWGVNWIRIENFMKEQKYHGKKVVKYVLPFERSADIDTYEDLLLAKKLFTLNQRNSSL